MALIEMLFTQTVNISPFIREGSGEPIFGEPETRKCRLQRGHYLQNVGGASGAVEQVVAQAKMFCVGEYIPPRSIVTHEGRDYTVINCEVLNGFADHHLEVYLE